MAVPWASLALTLVQGGVFLWVAGVVHRRDLKGHERTANHLFAVWWGIAGVLVLSRGAIEVFQALRGPLLAAQVTYVYLVVLLIVVGVWALSSYLVYLFTGSPRSWQAMAFLYGLLLVALFYLISYAHPVALEAGQWQVELVYENDLSGLPAVQVLIVLLFLPPVLGAIAYFSIVFRIDGGLQRYRILLVSGSIAMWFSSTIAASLLGWNETDAWRSMGRLVGVLAALLILLAYYPPSFIRKRLEDPT